MLHLNLLKNILACVYAEKRHRGYGFAISGACVRLNNKDKIYKAQILLFDT